MKSVVGTIKVKPCPKCGRKIPIGKDGKVAGHLPCDGKQV